MSKKLVFSLLACASLLLTTACQSVDAVIDDARNLQANVSQKITEVRTGLDNVVNEAQSAYQTLLEKKQQLETMVVEINEAVAAINNLLGKETNATETVELQQTIDELKAALAAAKSTLNEVEATEGQLAEEPAPSEETPAATEETTTTDSTEVVE